MSWIKQPLKSLTPQAAEAAEQRQSQLTKPPGALGRLEDLAIQLAALQDRECPQLENITITIFAADHGVAAEGVSLFPQSVTVEMIRNFGNGGAAICVLADSLGARLEVIDVGAVSDAGEVAGLVSARIGNGTDNFCEQAAMNPSDFEKALSVGRDAVERACEAGVDLFIGGEMGIANTTSATAIACAALDLPAEELTGPGTGLDTAGVQHKITVIERALTYHRDAMSTPEDVLQRLGGFEIVALVGAYIACAQRGVSILVDGFITCVAALMAERLRPGVRDWLIFGHASAEPGAKKVLQALQAEPVLDMGLRLGEGSGAAVAVSVLRQAVALHNNMATFADAAVSEQLDQE